MSYRLQSVAEQFGYLERAFISDNVQAFRVAVRELNQIMDAIPGENLPIREPVFLADSDGCENAL